MEPIPKTGKDTPTTATEAVLYVDMASRTGKDTLTAAAEAVLCRCALV